MIRTPWLPSCRFYSRSFDLYHYHYHYYHYHYSHGGSYQSEGSLLKTQCFFLDILESISSSLWDMNYTVKNVCFELIFRLLKRGELSDLSLLGKTFLGYCQRVMNRIWSGKEGCSSQRGRLGVCCESSSCIVSNSQWCSYSCMDLWLSLWLSLSSILIIVIYRSMRRELVNVFLYIALVLFLFVWFGYLPLVIKLSIFYGIATAFGMWRVPPQSLWICWVWVRGTMQEVCAVCWRIPSDRLRVMMIICRLPFWLIMFLLLPLVSDDGLWLIDDDGL